MPETPLPCPVCPGMEPPVLPVPDVPRKNSWFRVATWNVLYSVGIARLEPVLVELLERNVTVLLMQESQGRDINLMLARHGLEFHKAGELIVAWDPKAWERVEEEIVDLSDTPYYRQGGARVDTKGARVLLKHKRTGRTINALSYHLPSAVQSAGEPSRSVPRRLAALRNAMVTLGQLAKAEGAHLFGGDDNVDERKGRGWGFMLQAATGLRQIVAPAGTHGSRKIDDFRVRGLRPGKGWVLPTPGDHRVHIRDFTWL